MLQRPASDSFYLLFPDPSHAKYNKNRFYWLVFAYDPGHVCDPVSAYVDHVLL